MNHRCIQVIAVNASLRSIKLREHLKDITHVEVRPQGQLSSLLLQLAFNLAHVTDSLSEISCSMEQVLVELGSTWEKHVLSFCEMVKLHRSFVEVLTCALYLVISSVKSFCEVHFVFLVLIVRVRIVENILALTLMTIVDCAHRGRG